VQAVEVSGETEVGGFVHDNLTRNRLAISVRGVFEHLADAALLFAVLEQGDSGSGPGFQRQRKVMGVGKQDASRIDRAGEVSHRTPHTT